LIVQTEISLWIKNAHKVAAVHFVSYG
jgi:hypothetical protein